MNDSSLFYYRTASQAPVQAITVHSLGLRESMPPGVIRHGGPGNPFLFMYFHNEAFLNPGQPEALPVAHTTILWDKDAFHQYGNPLRPWLHSWISVGGTAVEESVKNLRIPLNQPLSFEGEALFLKYLGLIYDELHSYVVPDLGILEGSIAIWMRQTARALGTGATEATLPKPMKDARAFMESNLQRMLTLDEIARSACLSPSRFSAVFLTHFGVSPMQFVKRLRMRRAERLLRDENLAVFQVARLCGYDDPFHFSKQFHQHAGLSPRAYRRQRSGSAGAAAP